MSNRRPRLTRESKTVAAMITLYCHDQHQDEGGLCLECKELSNYAHERLNRCPFHEDKTTCAKCPVHCYRSEMREKVRTVMRYAGPRMLHRHPVMALLHLVDGFRKEPAGSHRRAKGS